MCVGLVINTEVDLYFFFTSTTPVFWCVSPNTHNRRDEGLEWSWKYCCWLFLLLLQPSRKQIQVTWPHIRTSLLPLADSSRALLRGSSAGPGDGLHLQGGRRFRQALFFSHFAKVVAWLRKHQREKSGLRWGVEMKVWLKRFTHSCICCCTDSSQLQELRDTRHCSVTPRLTSR